MVIQNNIEIIQFLIMETNSSKHKESSFKIFLKWFFGIIILLIALLALSNNNRLSFLFYLVSALICIPYTYSLLKKELSTILKYSIVILFFVFGYISTPKTNNINNNTNNNISNKTDLINKNKEESKDSNIELNEKLDNTISTLSKGNSGKLLIKEIHYSIIKDASILVDRASSDRNDIDSINKKSVILKDDLQKFQVKKFPEARREYVENLDKKLWEFNVDVKCIGNSCKTIEIVGGRFASNRNIKDTYIEIADNLTELRFDRVNFKWIEHDNDYTYYKVKSKNDNEIWSYLSK